VFYLKANDAMVLKEKSLFKSILFYFAKEISKSKVSFKMKFCLKRNGFKEKEIFKGVRDFLSKLFVHFKLFENIASIAKRLKKMIPKPFVEKFKKNYFLQIVCKKNGIKKTRFQNLCESFESLKTLSKMV
jgi:hypothetical protein